MALIELIAVSTENQQLLAESPDLLTKSLGLTAACGWPSFDHAISAQPDENWPFFFFVHKASSTIIGSGGFLSPPDATGYAQVGYEVAPAFRNIGIATEAMIQIIAMKPATPIAAVVGESNNASICVLRKLGFSRAKESVQHSGQLHQIWTKARAAV